MGRKELLPAERLMIAKRLIEAHRYCSLWNLSVVSGSLIISDVSKDYEVRENREFYLIAAAVELSVGSQWHREKERFVIILTAD